LALKVRPPAAAQIDSAEIVFIVIAGAADREAAIPTRVRPPAATTIVAVAITIATATPGCYESGAATAIDPYAASIDAPVPTANALGVGKLADDARVAPWHFTARIRIVATGAIHRIAISLRTHRRYRYKKK
jgi:hypothetical protein